MVLEKNCSSIFSSTGLLKSFGFKKGCFKISSRDVPYTFLPLTSLTTIPGRIPAFCAGECLRSCFTIYPSGSHSEIPSSKFLILENLISNLINLNLFLEKNVCQNLVQIDAYPYIFFLKCLFNQHPFQS